MGLKPIPAQQALPDGKPCSVECVPARVCQNRLVEVDVSINLGTTQVHLPNGAEFLITHDVLAAALVANLNSFALDYIARQKIGGTSMNYFILKQLPVLPPTAYDQPAPWDPASTLAQWISPRVLELTYTARDLQGFGRDLDWDGPPFRWDPERRCLLRTELDTAFFHLYGLHRDDVAHVLDTFPIVRRNDERSYGEYRTKRFILECFDAMAKATISGETYRTGLVPPPADPSVAHSSQS